MDANERRNRASREAADWWALLQGDDMTRAEREGFVEWLRDSQTNVAEMLRLSQVHGALSQFREWADISTDRPLPEDPGNVVSLPTASPASPLPRVERVASKMPGEDAGGGGKGDRSIRLFAFAATLASIIIVTAVLVPQFRGQWITTERGERREVALDDGSVVQIDPETRLNIRFSDSVRRVVLKQGRAVFRVAKNLQRPFRVEADDTAVRAIGTAFGVDRRAQGHVVVTVSEGKVAVTSRSVFSSRPPVSPHVSPRLGHPSVSDGEGSAHAANRVMNNASPSIPLEESEREIVVAANEQVTVERAGVLPLVQAVDSERELAWAEGRLVFKDDTVADVITEFNRYNRVQLSVTDPTLAARPVTGVFDAANPEGFLAFLENAAPVLIERDQGRSIVISPNPL